MIIDQLAALAASGESETLEFKETTGTRREATMTVCAFLNQGGGQALFGVTLDGAVVGQQVSERTIEELSAEIRQIDPPAFPTVEMSAAEYNRMLFERMHSEQRWENQPLDGWSVDDLDVPEIRRTVAEAVRRGRLEYEMPQCLLRVARFRGLDRMEFMDNRQFNGNAFTLLANAERFLRDTLPIAGRFEQDRFERIDEPLYPPLAARERPVPPRLLHRRRLGRHSGLRRPPRGHVLRLPALRPDAGEAVRAARVTAVEPVDCPHILPARHHRGVGQRDAEDGGPGEQGGAPGPGDHRG